MSLICFVYTPGTVLKELDIHVTMHHECILLSTTNKMQRYTIFFIIVNALHDLGGFSAHHQELKNCTHSIWHMPVLLLLPLAVLYNVESCWLYLKEVLKEFKK
jgi:hypothetical protein